MCNICKEWRIKANSIWNQVFGEYKRFEVLVPLLPSPFKEQHTLLQINFNWKNWRLDEDNVAMVIDKLGEHLSNMPDRPCRRLEDLQNGIGILQNENMDDLLNFEYKLWPYPVTDDIRTKDLIWLKKLQKEEKELIELLKVRNQVISSGQDWLDFLKKCTDANQNFLKMSTYGPISQIGSTASSPLMEMEARNQMMREMMATMTNINSSWNKLSQDIEFRQNVLNRRELAILSGMPFIDVMPYF